MQKLRFLTFFAIFSIISLYDAKALTIASTESVTQIKNALDRDISTVQDNITSMQKSVDAHTATLSDLNSSVSKISSKQTTLSNDNVKTTGSSEGFVSSVTASNGSISITKTELSIPVGSYDKPTARAQIWIQ